MSVFPSSKTRILGDFEFIQNKVLDGDYFQISGDINNLNDTIEFIVPDLKTAFLIEAKIVISNHSGLAGMTTGTTQNTIAQSRVRADLKIDGVAKDTTNIGGASNMSTTGAHDVTSGGSGYGTIGDGHFNVVGLSLVGDGIKKIEIENTLDAGDAIATMSGYLV